VSDRAAQRVDAGQHLPVRDVCGGGAVAVLFIHVNYGSYVFVEETKDSQKDSTSISNVSW